MPPGPDILWMPEPAEVRLGRRQINGLLGLPPVIPGRCDVDRKVRMTPTPRTV